MLATIAYETRGLAFNKLVVMKEDDGDIKKRNTNRSRQRHKREVLRPKTRRLPIASTQTRIKRLQATRINKIK